MPELVSDLVCPKCKGVPYQLWRHQVQPGGDVFTNELRVGPQGGHLPANLNHKDLRCKHCDVGVVQRERR